MQYLCSCDWFLPASIMSSKFTHVIACISASFFLRRIICQCTQTMNLRCWDGQDGGGADESVE